VLNHVRLMDILHRGLDSTFRRLVLGQSPFTWALWGVHPHLNCTYAGSAERRWLVCPSFGRQDVLPKERISAMQVSDNRSEGHPR
jgi:hypothetical protein